ncbi:MAG: aminopeptidase [Verrucomicrobiales bacterium]
MHDPRIDKLAKQLVTYSTSVKRGDNVLIDAYDVPDSIIIALIRAIRKAGAQPYVNIQNAQVSRELLMNASEKQYDILAKYSLAQMKQMDAFIALRGSHNITETADVPAKNMALAMKKMRSVQNYRVNETRWCVLRWPHPAMAQQAGMSTESFENFFFEVCLLNYKKLLPAMKKLEALMSKTNKVLIKGNGTNLEFSMKGLKAIACGGTHNIPDGECFSAPVKNSVNGVIKYNSPTIYQGISFDDIELTFEKGKIVKATANNTKAINKILNSDPGAKYIGEFAIGFNPKIKEPMRDILFDEKIAGSFHFTPGQAYEGVADNGNRSQVHWDLVCIQRPEYGGGEIWFDNKLIRKSGKFIPKSLIALNY